MRLYRFFAAAAAAGLAAPAFGAAPAAEPPAIVVPAGISVQKAGKESVLADFKGLTLYTTTDKAPCKDACLESWTPLAAPAIAAAKGDWSIVTRPDGSRQWAYKGQALYTYVGDSKAGEATGEQGAWHAAKP